jgi:hypothetical protein
MADKRRNLGTNHQVPWVHKRKVNYQGATSPIVPQKFGGYGEQVQANVTQN